MEWIAWFRVRGDLLNVDDGGVLVERGSGLDDIKREKARAFLATAQAQLESGRPPPCAQDQRSERTKRCDFKELQGKRECRQRRVAKRTERRKMKEMEMRMMLEQFAACEAISIEPTIRRNGERLS